MVTAVERINRFDGVIGISGEEQNALVPQLENLHQMVEHQHLQILTLQEAVA